MHIPPDKDKLPKGTEKACIDYIPCKLKMQMVIKISSKIQFSLEGLQKNKEKFSYLEFPFCNWYKNTG